MFELALAVKNGDRGSRDDVDLKELSETLMDGALVIVGCVVAAVVLCLVVRAFDLRWTWAFSPLPAAAFLFGFSPTLGIAAGACLVGAGALGFVRQRQDIERGGTEAQAARERPGPLGYLRGAIERRRWRRERVRGGRLALGQGPNGSVHTVPFGERQGTRAFIIGAPGSGKTVTLATHAVAYVDWGYPVISVDPKGDRDYCDQLRSAAERAGRPFYVWTPDGPAAYNPLGRGTPSEIADKALAGEVWTEPHYLRQAQRYLGLELQALRAVGEWPPTLRSISSHLNPERFDALIDRVEGELGKRLRDYLGGLSQRSRAELGGVRDRLAVLEESELGRWLEPRHDGTDIDLAAALAENAVVYFQLDADRFPLASQMVGASIVVDLVSLTGQLQGRAMPGLVIVDEFAAVAAEEISRLLSRSRSAGLSVLLATQAFADLSLARPGDSSESLRGQVLSHVDYLVAHRQSEPEAAELLGQMAGTKPAWSLAERVGTDKGPIWELKRDGTKRRTREFVRHPDEFKSLGTGRAIVIEPASPRLAERVQVWPA